MRDKPRGLKRRLILALAPIVWAASVHAQSAIEDRWGWNYCSPPYPPACVRATSAGPTANAACAKDVDHYIAAVFAYRTCKGRELERAIAEANRVSSAFKCRTEKKYCDLYKGTR